MKRTLLPITVLAFSVNAMAQFGTAPDFTVTDINSASHHLYSWLNAGKVVVVDASATWCGPCWSLHQSHALENLYNNYGPNGTDQLRILFYEADASTTMADLQGLTGSTQGDWLTGTSYPVVNESAPLSLSSSVWWPLGFPTVSLIRPSDKEIVEDMWNFTYAQMVNSINQIITLAAVGIAEEGDLLSSVSLYPVPVADVLNVDLSAAKGTIDNLVITDATGRVVGNVAVGNDQRVEMNVAAYEAGVYFVSLRAGNTVLGTKEFVK
ncbi:MAG: T9SS type A sorting domain-containing protein [Flavobacteriales bacterium]|jgi:thiol-disulfide isomerase/thioredoxin|nr:T9SS type A sorting domain-containing protein [Flavobacteriales bacterium]MBK9073365.1 T9SS type A sorting domain-containing protein [Flavobacteriales bacterium]